MHLDVILGHVWADEYLTSVQNIYLSYTAIKYDQSWDDRNEQLLNNKTENTELKLSKHAHIDITSNPTDNTCIYIMYLFVVEDADMDGK